MADAIYKQDTLGISYLKEADVDLVSIGRAEKNLLLASTPEQRVEYKQAIDVFEAKLDSNMGKAKSILSTDQEKDLMEKYDRAWKERQEVLNQTVALAMNDRLQQGREAVDLSLGAGGGKSDAAENVLVELANLKGQQAKDLSSEIASTYRGIRDFMLLLAFGGILVALGPGVVISMSIAKPVAQLVKAAEKLAEGDVGQNIDFHSRNELGSLAEAFRKTAGSVKSVISEMNQTYAAAVEGKLSTRANASRHQGDFRKIVQGLNDTFGLDSQAYSGICPGVGASCRRRSDGSRPRRIPGGIMRPSRTPSIAWAISSPPACALSVRTPTHWPARPRNSRPSAIR